MLVAGLIIGLLGSSSHRVTWTSEILERAVQLVDDAGAVLERAVVYEREQRASWPAAGRAPSGETDGCRLLVRFSRKE